MNDEIIEAAEGVEDESTEGIPEPLDHAEVLARFQLASDAWGDIYRDVLKFSRFAAGDQWERKDPSKIQLTYNIVPSFVRYVSNNVKKNPPSIKIQPADQGDPKIAKVYDGFINTIERKSHAMLVYTSALEQCAESGLGMFRVVPEQIPGQRAELRIRHIKDPTSVYVDPLAKEPALTDALWFFAVTALSEETFKREWPDADLSNFTDESKDWYDQETVRIAEYWFRDEARDGKWSQWIISGSEILLKNESYPGTKIPLCVVHGRERAYDGERSFECITRDIVDPQRVFNHETTAYTAALARIGKARYIVEADHIEGYQPQWDAATVTESFYLPANRGPDGSMPQAIPPEPIPAGLMQGADKAAESMRLILGIRDASRDMPTNQSGKAIAMQQAQSDVSTYGYVFALEVAMQHCGEVLCELIPAYYNYDHTRHLIAQDGQVTPTQIGAGGVDLSAGSYECVVTTGPTYETKRQEVAEQLMALVQAQPGLMGVAGDLLVANLPIDNAQEIAARIRATMDPKILAASAGDDDQAPMQVAALGQQLQQAHQQIEQLTQALQHETQLLQQAQDQIQQKMQLQAADHAHEEKMQAAKSVDADKLAELQAQVQIILQQMKQRGAVELQDRKSVDEIHSMTHEANLEASMPGVNVSHHE